MTTPNPTAEADGVGDEDADTIVLASVILQVDEFWEDETTDSGWALMNIRAGLGKPHDGDCTKRPYSCLRCITDEYMAKARMLRALLLQPSPAPERAAGEEASDIADLAMMIRRLCNIIRSQAADPNSYVVRALDLADKASDLLKRKGLAGSPFRESPVLAQGDEEAFEAWASDPGPHPPVPESLGAFGVSWLERAAKNAFLAGAKFGRRSTTAPPREVPAGWVLVPKYISDEMADAADEAFHAELKRQREYAAKFNKPEGYASGQFSSVMWISMLAAAPPPHGSGEGGTSLPNRAGETIPASHGDASASEPVTGRTPVGSEAQPSTASVEERAREALVMFFNTQPENATCFALTLAKSTIEALTDAGLKITEVG